MNFFYSEKNFQPQTWPPVQHLITWLSLSRDWSTHETDRDSPPCFYWLATCLYCGKKNRPGDTIRGKVKKIFRCSREYDRTWRESPNFSRCGRKEGKLARYPAPHFEAWKVDSAAQRLQGEAVFVLQPSVCILNFVVNNFWSAARYFN